MAKKYVPERGDVVWMDFEPTRGGEIGKYRPALVLSSAAYAKASGLVICCAISTSIRGGPLEVPIDGLDRTSVVASNLVHSLDWRARHTKFIVRAPDDVVDAVRRRLLPLLGWTGGGV